MSCPLYTLCPKEGDFQPAILQNTSSGMVILHKTAEKTNSNHLSLLPPLLSLSQPIGAQGSARRAAEGHLVKKTINISSPHSSLHLCSRKCVWSSPEITTLGFC